MPLFSFVVPTHNGSAHIAECLSSILSQDEGDLEVVVVDDASSDDTVGIVSEVAESDPRVRLLTRPENGGTLRARRDGVLATTGDRVLLVDQDDELAPGALALVSDAVRRLDPDVLHFGVRVEADNPSAERAAAGMTSFLTPRPRRLEGLEILTTQFAECDGFDWHVHHKAFRGSLAREAWAAAEDLRLTLSDDLYASFLVCSMASTYEAVPDAAWYVYHLGRGETFGSRTTVRDICSIAERDLTALRLVGEFADSGVVARPDWAERVSDVRERLAEHMMNELHDGLAPRERRAALEAVLQGWPADAVAAELYRFVRDRAYALYDSRTYPTRRDELHLLLEDARLADARVTGATSERYQRMRAAAERHLSDLETLEGSRERRPGLLGRLLRRRPGR